MSDASNVVKCWEVRGCHGLSGIKQPMEFECPHNVPGVYSPCSDDCFYTRCNRPWHKPTNDMDLLFDPTVDRLAAVKKTCRRCEHFLKNGPRVDPDNPRENEMALNDVTSAGNPRIHLV